jgi:hypothetical protein
MFVAGYLETEGLPRRQWPIVEGAPGSLPRTARGSRDMLITTSAIRSPLTPIASLSRRMGWC